MRRHYFFSKDNTPLRQIFEYIKQSQGQTLQREIEDLFLAHHYPYVLMESEIAPDIILHQANASIRRLEQDILQLKTLISLLSISGQIQINGMTNQRKSTPSALIDEFDDEDEDIDESVPLYSPKLFLEPK